MLAVETKFGVPDLFCINETTKDDHIRNPGPTIENRAADHLAQTSSI